MQCKAVPMLYTLPPSPLSQHRYDPNLSAAINLQGTLTFSMQLRNSEYKCIVFSSTAAIYGDASQMPVTEEPSRIANRLMQRTNCC